MSEIADLTYNVVAFTEIMQMLWKRLNDHGRNWRHVYKALVLLEYLIKTGSEKVSLSPFLQFVLPGLVVL
jgi:epsin